MMQMVTAWTFNYLINIFRIGTLCDETLRSSRHAQQEQDTRQARSPAHSEYLNDCGQFCADLCDIKAQASAHSNGLLYCEFSPDGPHDGLYCGAFNGCS